MNAQLDRRNTHSFVFYCCGLSLFTFEKENDEVMQLVFNSFTVSLAHTGAIFRYWVYRIEHLLVQ
ncbi:hypothetical protein [Planococcus soli]|uniref:hypothetical protein n=1 Tax=Planococcus soli TaxID=2666072 RepID=UPI001942A8E2|nr:hypothetical protein [Planococcus soli]